jgi:alanine-glyoxylate transaminase/(R)-3-amino-2-methylpropionate-pyruvate transaminase
MVMEDRQYMHPLYQPFYKKPLLISEGYKQYLWDHTGRRYLDLSSGIATVAVGHAHPRISKVIEEQSKKLVHTSQIYMHEKQAEYAKMLCDSLGPGFDSVYFCNSGAEANDFALMMSRVYTNTTKVFSLRNGYHGLVGNAGGITSVGSWNQPVLRGYDTEKLAYPSKYRGNQKNTEGYLRDADEAFATTGSGQVAAFICEPIMGVGGVVPMPAGYMDGMYKMIRKQGGLCISDEVQTGFGRVGKKFWGFKWQGVQPDIVTMAKGIGNGFPMAAVATRREISQKMTKNYFNTFGGGPLQCAVGIEVLNILKDEQLPENAEVLGEHLRSRLWEIEKKSRIVGDIRGQGLMNAFELVKNKETKEPAVEEAAQLMELTR